MSWADVLVEWPHRLLPYTVLTNDHILVIEIALYCDIYINNRPHYESIHPYVSSVPDMKIWKQNGIVVTIF